MSRDSLPVVSVIVVVFVVVLVAVLFAAVIYVCLRLGTFRDILHTMFGSPMNKQVVMMRSNILYDNGSTSPAKVSFLSSTLVGLVVTRHYRRDDAWPIAVFL